MAFDRFSHDRWRGLRPLCAFAAGKRPQSGLALLPVDPYEQPNQLFINTGEATFTDISGSSAAVSGLVEVSRGAAFEAPAESV